MSTSYVPVLWNPFKKKYDRFLWSFIAIYLASFILLSKLLFPQLIAMTIVIRAFGTLAIILLHVILIIGPLCRLQPWLLPLLYNRRHLGVTMFCVASVHAVLSLVWFHSGGMLHPLVSLFAGNTHYNSLRFFPFQTLGFTAYIIFMIMAFTSHDFWLNFLSPKTWKAMHMMVYLAYALIIMHVMLGIIQLESSPLIFLMLITGLLTVATLHILAGIKEWKFDCRQRTIEDREWVYVCEAGDIEDSRAKMAIVNNERVAVFKYGNKLSAVHNVCKHQNGPLGEGKIVDGCITCPWHGYQYQPGDGCAPPPFTEKLATYRLKLKGNSVYVNVNALPEGTSVEPATIGEQKATDPTSFFIGWSDQNPIAIIKFVKRAALGLCAVALLVAVGFTTRLTHVAKSSFDYEDLKTIQGQLVSYPFPAIRTIAGKGQSGQTIIKTYPLVNDSKFGANGVVDSVMKHFNTDHYLTSINGAVIQRNDVTAMELSKGELSVKVSDKNNNLPAAELKKLADTSILGEIIDPKCYLGAMNPGEGKPHRACAILCISGGIMPILTFKDEKGEMRYAILQGPRGEKINNQVLNYVAEPVKITGILYRYDNWYVFYTDPANQIHPLFN
ncbi:Rieske 2Fe-2S domain-containing protein [Mucilaginibacter ginsenosidivorans]|uniref:Rieske 2Fe-2S domain-containing protein n=1 Tax=Mucilaginibacter ginsenosidivorans TaxID=398053 RepID=A0A5B8UZQ0_9SPHI|nr:Rieske 2Fe-2S domain-containing protein [Mucilaginibacter ginsenosidivorans]QEC64063.1 Rieske 2Fe-2S domain-containing protein [Mucilaginibacter ginsenosidivorans]